RADFQVRITYNKRWHDMDDSARAEVREGLELSWGPAGQLDYSSGYWAADRTYAQDGYGLVRRRFTAIH
ncbi:MAG: hypothetical protein ACE5JL_08315, partial [Dehalococcoidia bacterium]